MDARSEIRLKIQRILCYVIHCITAISPETCPHAKAESLEERRRKPRNVNVCARGISLTRPSRAATSASESETRKSAMYTDTHDTRGVTVHVRGVTPCTHLPDPQSGPRAHHRHGVGAACAICAAHAPLRNAYAILGTILSRVCKGRCSVASSKGAVMKRV